jgi:hypothetical protein
VRHLAERARPSAEPRRDASPHDATISERLHPGTRSRPLRGQPFNPQPRSGRLHRGAADARIGRGSEARADRAQTPPSPGQSTRQLRPEPRARSSSHGGVSAGGTQTLAWRERTPAAMPVAATRIGTRVNDGLDSVRKPAACLEQSRCPRRQVCTHGSSIAQGPTDLARRNAPRRGRPGDDVRRHRRLS